MKPTTLLLAMIALFCGGSQAQISSNKAFFLGTNNSLRPNETNFFAVNSNLLNASVFFAGGGGGFVGNPSQFSSAGGVSNIISGVALTNINAQGVSNSGYAVVVGNQTNSNTFRLYQGNTADLMDWFGTGGAAATMDHLANFVTLGNVSASNLTATTTLNATNFSSGGQTMTVGDGPVNGDYLRFDDSLGQVELFNSGNISTANPASITLDDQGNVMINPGGILGIFYPGGEGQVELYGSLEMTNSSFAYYQDNGSHFSLVGTSNVNEIELMDLQPSNFTGFYPNDLLVASGSSNNSNIRLQGDGTISAGRYWENTTNITGQPAFTASVYCTRITWSSNGGNCQITLPADNPVPWVLPTAATPFRGWNAGNASVGGGHGIMPVWMTGQYTVENLSSNSAYTLSVCLADHTPFTNWGTTNLTIPSQMGCRFTSPGTNGGTNIAAELFALSPSPTFNGQNISNLQATNLIATVKFITNGYSITANDAVLVCYGTNQLVTNNLAIKGYTVTVQCKGYGASVIITNTTPGTTFTVPGLGITTNAVYLGACNTPSNSWTGVYDGANW